jgi:2'-5' RNA ligase
VEDLRRRLLQEWPRGEQLVKWVEPANLHLTLKFLGHVHASRVPAVVQALTAVEASRPFPVRLVGLGAFPRPRGARVLWVGVEEGAGELADLARVVEDVLEPLGFPREGRPFSPHLTIGRLRTPAYHVELEVALDRKSRVEVGSQHVHSVELMESSLRPEGPVYTVVRSYRLGGRG